MKWLVVVELNTAMFKVSVPIHPSQKLIRYHLIRPCFSCGLKNSIKLRIGYIIITLRLTRYTVLSVARFSSDSVRHVSEEYFMRTRVVRRQALLRNMVRTSQDVVDLGGDLFRRPRVLTLHVHLLTIEASINPSQFIASNVLL